MAGHRKLPSMNITQLKALTGTRGREPLCWTRRDMHKGWVRAGKPARFTALDVVNLGLLNPEKFSRYFVSRYYVAHGNSSSLCECHDSALRVACCLLPVGFMGETHGHLVRRTILDGACWDEHSGLERLQRELEKWVGA